MSVSAAKNVLWDHHVYIFAFLPRRPPVKARGRVVERGERGYIALAPRAEQDMIPGLHQLVMGSRKFDL